MISIRRGSVEASIDPNGAWVSELRRDDVPVFFPRTELKSENGDVKQRGGMHVCLPNFGPGGDSGLPQHGFGRTHEWRVVSKHGAHVELLLENGSSHYMGLESRLVYEVSSGAFKAKLVVKNVDGLSLRLAPAFHPYFQLDEPESAVMVNGTVYELSELAGTEFIEADTVDFRSHEQRLSLSQQGLGTWAIWTDRLGDYVCVEPTFGGNRFLEPLQPGEELLPGDVRTYQLTISF